MGFLERLQIERSELKAKLGKLAAFMATDGYRELPMKHQCLLRIQRHTMDTYVCVLDERLLLLATEQ